MKTKSVLFMNYPKKESNIINTLTVYTEKRGWGKFNAEEFKHIIIFESSENLSIYFFLFFSIYKKNLAVFFYFLIYNMRHTYSG